MSEGSAKLVTDGETVTVNAGDVFYIPYGCKYQSFWYGEPKIKFLSLAFPLLPSFNEELYVCQTVPHEESDVDLFFKMASLGTPNASGIAMLYALAASLLPKMKTVHKCQRKLTVESVKRYLEKDPYVSTQELCEKFALSESALYLAFKTYSDKSINEYRSFVIMERAKDLLISTDMPIEVISERLKFSSSSYFRKKFQSEFGTSPRAMRKNFRM